MDCEILQQIQRYMEPQTFATKPDDIALEAPQPLVRTVTSSAFKYQDRYETAFYQPFVSDWRNYEAWEAAGATWTAERAHDIYLKILAEFEAPEISEDIKEELAQFVAKRKAEGGAPTDF